MNELFEDIPEIALKIILMLLFLVIIFQLKYLPNCQNLKINEGLDESDYLIKLSKEGLNQRIENMLSLNLDQYFKRLDYELSIIIKMGFAGYFLIVADFVNWAKKNNIPVGPGRGSGAGSLVAWALRITDLRSIKL